MSLHSLDGKYPSVHPSAFISKAAYIVGDVRIGAYSSVWPGAVIRADSGKIVIGERTNVQDNSVVHADADASIGNNVTIGHGVVCHSRKIGDGCLIGNGSVLNDGVELDESCLVAAGTTVTENSTFPARSLIRGTPGKRIGRIREKHYMLQQQASQSYTDRIQVYKSSGLGTSEITIDKPETER